MLFCCLWRNVETFCHKHFVVVSRHQQTPPLTTSGKCHNLPRSGGAVFLTPSQSQRWQQSIDSQLFAQNRDLCLPHLHSTPPLRGFPSEYRHKVWYWKTKMVCLHGGEKIYFVFVLRECTNVTDTHKHRHTDTARQHSRPCIASRDKNWTCGSLFCVIIHRNYNHLNKTVRLGPPCISCWPVVRWLTCNFVGHRQIIS